MEKISGLKKGAAVVAFGLAVLGISACDNNNNGMSSTNSPTSDTVKVLAASPNVPPSTCQVRNLCPHDLQNTETQRAIIDSNRRGTENPSMS